MFYSLKGILMDIGANFAVIECAGVGYKCMTSAITQSNISEKIGSEVKLFTYLNVRQDTVDLFGFSSLDELNSFKTLTTVSGVGAKAGLAILSIFNPQQLLATISSSDIASLTSVQGIGAKTAQRIILELKGKLNLSENFVNSIAVGVKSAANNVMEATKALITLGFNQNDIMPELSNLDPSKPVEELVREVLKRKKK